MAKTLKIGIAIVGLVVVAGTATIVAQYRCTHPSKMVSMPDERGEWKQVEVEAVIGERQHDTWCILDEAKRLLK
jgi:hypothetical protein